MNIQRSIWIVSVMTMWLKPFQLGIEALPENYGKQLRVRGIEKVALLTNQSGRDQQGRRTIDILIEKEVPLVGILVPEHGLEGMIKAEMKVHDGKDIKTGIPIKSVYGGGGGQKMDVEYLKTVQMVIFDIQDAGIRHYTYISTLLELLKGAAQTEIDIVVLDRPNMLGPIIEGPVVQDHLVSFISAPSLPLRYGLTVGELSRYFNHYVLEKPARLTVIPMKEYKRTNPGTLSVHLSPNIKTIHSCWYYSFLGLLSEIRPFDMGVATNMAFECLLLPEKLKIAHIIWKQASQLLAKHGIQSKEYRYYSERKKQFFTGLRFIGTQHIPKQAFHLFAELIVLFKKAGVELTLSSSFEKAAGASYVKQFVENNIPIEQLLLHTKPELERFYNRASTVLLYPESTLMVDH